MTLIIYIEVKIIRAENIFLNIYQSLYYIIFKMFLFFKYILCILRRDITEMCKIKIIKFLFKIYR